MNPLACTLLFPALAAFAETPAAPQFEPVRTTITVTAHIASESPGFVSSMDAARLAAIPGVNLDDRLRQTPGFTLFRRSSSLTANPTTQGVSLRGLGSSGAGRTLVLWDGIPVNDPFGGWVYWTRLAPQEMDRVEISRGASTSIFGDRALAGVISLFSRAPERLRFDAGYEGGNRDTHEISTGLSDSWGNWAASAYARAFTTGGYFIVPDAYRGAVDRKASVRFTGGDVRLDRSTTGQRLFLKLDILAEERANGTVLQRNSTSLGTISAHYDREFAGGGVSLLAWHSREQYHQSFSAIAADRRTERLTTLQTVPSEATGAGGFWRKGAPAWNLLAGADFTRVEGYSRERGSAGLTVSGGTQHQQGVFVQSDASLGPARFFAGARAQRTGAYSFFSPSAGVAAGRGPLRARASVYRGFRAATLNELFRNFRVGNAVTLANDRLRPESVFGAEAGVDYVGERTSASVSVFRNSLRDLITNVTLSVAPDLITRRRQNAASALARGAEVNLRRNWRRWRGDVGYLFSDSRFAAGTRIPQVPRHQGTAQLSWNRGGTFVSAGLRTSAFQFEDEINTFLIPGYAALHAYCSHRLGAGLTAHAAVENLLDRVIIAGFTPAPTLAGPRLWRVGVRWEFGRP